MNAEPLVVSLDFWNTLYAYDTAPEERRAERDSLLAQRLRHEGVADEALTASLFDVASELIKDGWRRGTPLSRAAVATGVGQRFPSYDRNRLSQWLSFLEDLYAGPLAPVPLPGAAELVDRVSSLAPLYLVSDTFFVPGRVIRHLLIRDGIFACFTGVFFSDELLVKKPDPASLLAIAARERIKPQQIIHVGDTLESDGEAARACGADFLLLAPESVTAGGPVGSFAPSLPAVARMLEARLRGD